MMAFVMPALARAADCVSSAGGVIRTADVVIPQQGGGTLSAKVFAPESARQIAPCPCITMLPGGGAAMSSVEWSAAELARRGYVVIITLPASGGSAASYNTAAKSGLDYLLSSANPFRASLNPSRVGAAGWSLGARALSRTQDEDPRIDAIVAWDNLAISETGDMGSPACTNVPGVIRTPRAPALGQASDSCDLGIESKKTAFNHWRSAGVPAYQVVFQGSTHFWWGGSNTAQQEAIANYYTLAWFDRWLKDDPTALARLMSPMPAGQPIAALLSSHFRSAAFLDGVDCADLRAGCCTVDFNADGVLSQEDLTGYLTALLDETAPPGPSGTSVAPCSAAAPPYDTLGWAADFNRDCGLDQEDLAGFITEYFAQAESPTACVPG